MDEPVQEAPVKRSRLALLTLIAVILAAGLAALFWLDARQRIGGTQEELARRLRDIEGDVREARSTARQSQELLREAQAKIGQLESRLAESQSQQLALEALYQELSRNRDEWQLAGAGGESRPGRRRAGILVAPRLRDPQRAALAGGGAPGQSARPAAAAADAGLLPAREPALEAAQCAALAADARRGRLPRGHARGAGLGAALLRHALEADCRRAGAVEDVVVGLAQLRDAKHLGELGGGPRIQVAPRARAGMSNAG